MTALILSAFVILKYSHLPAAIQFSPLLKKTAPSAALTAFSRSQSPKMMSGLFPPSSRLTFFRLDLAQDSMMVCPIPVLPVKPSLRTFGWSAMAWPVTLPLPGSTLMTPGGMPALAASSANLSAVSGLT
jgi:hypothetical protein